MPLSCAINYAHPTAADFFENLIIPEKPITVVTFDVAEQVITQYLRRHHATVANARPLAHAAVDFPVLRAEKQNARLYAALCFYESGCRASARSYANSVGILQINPKIWRKYSVKQLLDPTINAAYGASILASYVRSYGLFQGLHRYNGLGSASNPTDDSYAVKVYQLAGFKVPEGAVVNAG